MFGFSQALVVAAVAIMVVGFFVAATQSSGDRSKSWLAFGCGGILYLFGEITWGLREMAGEPLDSVSLADAFWLGAFPLYFAALHFRTRASERPAPLGEGWLESVVVMGVFALLLWETELRSSIGSAGSSLDAVVRIAYPVGDLGLLWLVLRSVYRYDARWDQERALLAGGLLILVAADTVWSLPPGSTLGPYADSLYVLAALMMGGAGFRAATVRPRQNRQRGRPGPRPLLFELMPYVAGITAAAVPVWQMAHGDRDFAVALLAVVLLALVFARQAMTLRQNRRLREAAEDAALSDGLTGLRNHTYFHERLHGELARARRSGEQLALLMIDVDDFKQINDRAGHPVGDQALREIGHALTAVSRPSDIACRVGGDEFAVILPASGRDGITAFAARIGAAAAKIALGPSVAGSESPPVSLSVGACLYPADAADAGELVAHADVALYSSKRRGRGESTIYDPAVTVPAGAKEELSAAREEIRARELDFRVLFEATREPMLILGEDGWIVDANAAAASLVGLSTAELTRRSIFDFEATEPMELKRRRHLEEGHEEGEQEIRLPDGRVRTIEFTATNVSPGRHVLILRDVTDRRAAAASASQLV